MRAPRSIRRRPGAAAAELAILLPFLGLMFVTALDFCRVFYAAQTIENSARSAALYASGNAVNPQAGGLDQAVQYDCPLLTPVLGPSGTITISRSVTMAVAPKGP